MATTTLDHSQCLPFCGHLIKVYQQRAAVLVRLAQLDQALKELDREVAELKAQGANA
jgi:cell division protein FtsB